MLTWHTVQGEGVSTDVVDINIQDIYYTETCLFYLTFGSYIVQLDFHMRFLQQMIIGNSICYKNIHIL